MSPEENKSIAYIYNEMDPSEKLEFERELKNDNDLLIEVESLKQISKNLDQLESIEPPAHIIDAVFQSAQESTQNTKSRWKVFSYSTAALIVAGITSGVFFMMDSNVDTVDNPETEAASVSSGSNQAFIPSGNSSNITNDRLQPWVDKNEVIYFQAQSTGYDPAALDSIRNASLKKLTPVNPSEQRVGQRQLQLTGSSN